MPFWKQRLFARLHAPADEGSDLGAAPAAESAPQADSATTEAPAAADQPQEQPAAEAAPQEQPEAAPAPAPAKTPLERLSERLDAITDDPNREQVKAPGDRPKEEAPKPQAPAEPARPRTPEQEEAELLDGVKSERGRERIKAVFAEKKQLEQDNGQFRQMIEASGMGPQEFAQALEFGRLTSSAEPQNLRAALDMIEAQRATLCARLGIEAPGVDLLKDHADLRTAVDGMEMGREQALELARYRQHQADVQRQQQAQQAQQQQQVQFQQQVQQASQAMEAYLQTRASDIDHPARMKLIGEHFAKPENMQRFVGTYRPEQWAATVQMMYDSITVPRPAPGPQPLRSRPALQGTPAPSSTNPMDRVAQRMEQMGL